MVMGAYKVLYSSCSISSKCSQWQIVTGASTAAAAKVGGQKVAVAVLVMSYNDRGDDMLRSSSCTTGSSPVAVTFQ